MAGVKAKINVNVSATHQGTADLGTPEITVGAAAQLVFKAGNLAVDECDVMFSDGRTLAASANEDLDLNGTTLKDAFGNNAVFAEVCAIYIEAAGTNTNNVVLGGAATNAFVGPFGAATHTLAVQPGMSLLLTSKNGWTVTAATADLLRVANSGAGSQIKYNIVIIGRSVAA